MSLNGPRRSASAMAIVANRISSASGSGIAAGVRRASDTPSTPMTAGPMPFMTARTHASCRTRSRTGRIASMITNDGRNADVRRDHEDRAGGELAEREAVDELARREPAELSDDLVLDERDHRETATDRERAGLEPWTR